MIFLNQSNYLDSKNLSGTRIIAIHVLCGSIPNLGLKAVPAHKMQIWFFDNI